MKCLILFFLKGQQTFQYSIACKMMKTMFNTHKIIIKYEHVVYFNKRKKRLLSSKIKMNKMQIVTQVNEPSSCYIQTFINSFPRQINTTSLMLLPLFKTFNINTPLSSFHLIDVTSFIQNLQYKYTPFFFPPH